MSSRLLHTLKPSLVLQSLASSAMIHGPLPHSLHSFAFSPLSDCSRAEFSSQPDLDLGFLPALCPDSRLLFLLLFYTRVYSYANSLPSNPSLSPSLYPFNLACPCRRNTPPSSSSDPKLSCSWMNFASLFTAFPEILLTYGV